MENERTRIILLGGIYGVGKTTVAHHLANRLDIFQRSGLGAIVKTLRVVLPDNNVVREWGKYKSGDRAYLENKLHQESKIMGKIITEIVRAAHSSGENYIIDGVQLLPEYLPLNQIDLGIITVSDKHIYENRFQHPTQTRKLHNNNATLSIALVLESIILRSAHKYQIPVFENNNSVQETCINIEKYFGLTLQ